MLAANVQADNGAGTGAKRTSTRGRGNPLGRYPKLIGRWPSCTFLARGNVGASGEYMVDDMNSTPASFAPLAPVVIEGTLLSPPITRLPCHVYPIVIAFSLTSWCVRLLPAFARTYNFPLGSQQRFRHIATSRMRLYCTHRQLPHSHKHADAPQ